MLRPTNHPALDFAPANRSVEARALVVGGGSQIDLCGAYSKEGRT
jgi:hypothetical protein